MEVWTEPMSCITALAHQETLKTAPTSHLCLQLSGVAGGETELK